LCAAAISNTSNTPSKTLHRSNIEFFTAGSDLVRENVGEAAIHTNCIIGGKFGNNSILNFKADVRNFDNKNGLIVARTPPSQRGQEG